MAALRIPGFSILFFSNISHVNYFSTLEGALLALIKKNPHHVPYHISTLKVTATRISDWIKGKNNSNTTLPSETFRKG